MCMARARVPLWRHEPYYSSPARKTVEINWTGELRSAVLSLDVDPCLPPWQGCIDRLVVNGVDVDFTGDRCDKISADVMPYLRQGFNTVEFYFNPNPMAAIGIQSGGAYGYITVDATGEISAKPPEEVEEVVYFLFSFLFPRRLLVLL